MRTDARQGKLVPGEVVMATKFSEFMRGIEEEARSEGPEAIAQLEAFRDRIRLGRQLARARLGQHLSQTQVAKRSLVDRQDVSGIERGIADPTLATLRAVAGAVGLTIHLQRRPAGATSSGQ